MNAYTLAFAALLLTGGWLGDRWGARTAYLVGLASFTAASALCAAATGLAGLVAARAVQGLGAALLVPASLTLIERASHDAEEQSRAIGLWALCGAAAMAAGPLVGGVLITPFGWRSLFLVNLPVGLIGVVLALRVARDDRPHRTPPFDLLGQVAIIVGLITLIGVLIEGRTAGPAFPLVPSGLAVCVAAFVAFVVIETRQAHPMLPPRLFRGGVFPGAIQASAASAFIFYGLSS